MEKKNKIVNEEELNDNLQEQINNSKYQLSLKKFIIIATSLALLTAGGMISYEEYQKANSYTEYQSEDSEEKNQREMSYEQFVDSTKIENIDITEVTDNQLWKIVTLLGRRKSSFGDGTVQYGEWIEQGQWIILNDDTFEKNDMLSYKVIGTSNIYNNVMTTLANGDIEVFPTYEKFNGPFDYSKYNKLFIVGKNQMFVDGKVYYISTYETKSNDDPNSEWVEDGNLYISYGALGGSDVARFNVVGEVDINNILENNQSIRK